MSGLYHARELRGMSRTELVKLSGVSKQQLSRLENGGIRLRLDHLKPFAGHLGYTPEQILLWGRFPGTGGEASSSNELAQSDLHGAPAEQVAELDSRSGIDRGAPAATIRKDGRHTDRLKPERWVFPETFVRDQLHSAAAKLLVIEVIGDSMAPTVMSGDRVIVDTGHKTPTPDGLYAIRDAFDGVAVKRLQSIRSERPARVKIISDNPNHATEEVQVSELAIFGKVLCCLKLV